jgi:glycolate oxidase
MAVKKSRESIGKDLRRIIDADKVKCEAEDLLAYSSDSIRYYAKGDPDAVVLAASVDDVSKTVKYANDNEIALTSRGAGSGLSGGSTPIQGGIVLDTKRMNSILDINKGNMTARVESGVVLANFHRSVEKERLFYPPDPQSMDVCTIGGNISTRAGGPRGVKYGTTGDYVLGLEVVLADGSVINTGGVCVKTSAGYNITKLLTGAEGTLGVITKANLRLVPLPAHSKTVFITCDTVQLASEIVSKIIYEGVIPAVLEYLTAGAMGLMNSYNPMPIPLDGQAYLLLELDGTNSAIDEDVAKLKSICSEMKAKNILAIDDKNQADLVWEARKNLSPLVLRILKKTITEDFTVPRDMIPTMVTAIGEISQKVGIGIGMAGHAGDGNIHPNILMAQITEENEKKAIEAIDMIAKKCLELGGTVSGEHGIGLHKSYLLALECGQTQIDLMKRIKQAFDPKGIMNPGKLWTEAVS